MELSIYVYFLFSVNGVVISVMNGVVTRQYYEWICYFIYLFFREINFTERAWMEGTWRGKGESGGREGAYRGGEGGEGEGCEGTWEEESM